MPIDPALGRQLADLGGSALLILLVVIIGIGLWRQWWVPGWLYKQERDARLIAETQATRNAEALQKLARAVTRERDKPAATGKGSPDADT